MKRQLMTAAALLVLGSAAFAANPDQKPLQPSDKPPAQQHFGSGARIDQVDADGAAASAGIKAGDVILAINGKPINSHPEINSIVAASGKRPLVIDIDRGGTHVRVKVTPRVVNEATAQGNVQHKVLGISHTDMVPDTDVKRPQNLMNMTFPPEKEKGAENAPR
jgi:membrane-associated protease RseP (regulator of RpoE activity)